MATQSFEMEKIDFVLLWVDDSDPQWQEQYRHYSQLTFGDARSVRYRDWGTLKYWFRGVEQFAPWVNKIFFVTCGHYPEWLNINHPKLRFVKHSDFIPAEYLPTFSCNPIELNLHRIKGLSERFVYFNDDTFIINHISKNRFFKNGLPCDIAGLNAPQPLGDMIDHIITNDIAFANRFFNKKKVISSHWIKWFTPIYRNRLIRTFALLYYPHFTGFIDPHLPNAYLKKTLDHVWAIYGNQLDLTCNNKFRTPTDVNQYVFRYYQLLSGQFEPINPYSSSITYSTLNDNLLTNAISDIKEQRKQLICINDGEVSDFQSAKKELCAAFETILANQSEFELC